MGDVMEDFISEEVKMSIEADERAISAKLRNLRVRSCITIDDFAEALGVESSELEAYENGIENVPASVIALACALSGTAYEHFFCEQIEEVVFQAEAHSALYEKQPALLS